MNALAHAIAVILFAAATGWPPPALAVDRDRDLATDAARATFERFTGSPLRAGFRVEPTLVPRYYTLRSDVPGRGGVYFREDMAWTANVRGPGWSAADGSHSNPQALAAWYREVVLSLPLDRLVPVKRETPFVAVIWSAPDCPVCRKLEASLEAAGASVYVAPVGLSEEGFRRAAQAYCARDSGAAWRAAMGGQKANPESVEARADCGYPRDQMVDLGYFLGRGRLATPLVVFADGTGITGWDDRLGPERLREMLSGKRFFSAR